MSEPDNATKEKRKKVRGFAGIIWNQIGILNESEYFKKNYGQLNLKVLLISTDDKHAAYVKIKDGTVDLDDLKYEKEDPKAIKSLIKDNPHEGLLKTDTETFFAIATGKMSTMGLLKMVLKKEIQGVKAMLTFSKLLRVSAHETKNKAKEKSAKSTPEDQTKMES
jgi:hypothetical protein